MFALHHVLPEFEQFELNKTRLGLAATWRQDASNKLLIRVLGHNG